MKINSIPSRPYRNEEVRKERIRSVTELHKSRREQTDKLAKNRAEKAKEQLRCFVCGRPDGLKEVTAPGVAYQLCPAHFNEAAGVMVEKLKDMKSIFASMGEVDEGVSVTDTGDTD